MTGKDSSISDNRKAPEVSKFQSFKTVRVHRSQITPAPYNPRIRDKSTKKKLRQSLKDHGLAEPLILNSRNNTLIGGHGRLEQLDVLEGSLDYYLDVAAVDVDERGEKSLNVALNNQNLQGQFDLGLLEELMGQPGFDIAGTGFTRPDLGLMFDEGILNGMFGGAAAEQAEAEAPAISQLAEMKAAGSAADKERKQRLTTTAATGNSAAAAGQADLFADPVSPIDSTESAGVGDLADSADPTADKAAYRDLLIQRRKAYQEKSQDANDSEFMLVLVGDTSAEVDRFMLAIGLPLEDRYPSLRSVADAMGLEF